MVVSRDLYGCIEGRNLHISELARHWEGILSYSIDESALQSILSVFIKSIVDWSFL